MPKNKYRWYTFSIHKTVNGFLMYIDYTNERDIEIKKKEIMFSNMKGVLEYIKDNLR